MKYKLVCFDVDGTLISDEGGKYWERLHAALEGERGKTVQKERTRLFQEGKLSHERWVDLDVGGFKDCGFTKADLERVARTHELLPGARKTALELHTRGYKLAVISGSLGILIDTLFPDHPFDDVFVNEISFDKEGRIKDWKATVFDAGTKHKALHAICERERIPLSEAVFVGDGENDIDILKEAGLGIAFCPKSEKVAAAADVVVRKKDLWEILKHL